MPDQRAEIECSGLFEDVQLRRYVWEVSYGAESTSHWPGGVNRAGSGAHTGDDAECH